MFSYIALYLTQRIVGGFVFDTGNAFILTLVVLALTLLNLLMVPVFRLISLPDKGVAFLVLSFVMTLITMYILTVLVPFFRIVATTLPELNIFGFVLPSKHLTMFWSAVFSALLFTVIYLFFSWLTAGKKKKAQGK